MKETFKNGRLLLAVQKGSEQSKSECYFVDIALDGFICGKFRNH